MKHLEWDDNDELQAVDEHNALDDMTDTVDNLQNVYNNISDALSNIGTNKEDDGMPSSSDNEDNSDESNPLSDSADDNNTDNETNDSADDGDEEEFENDSDNDGIDDNLESSPDDDNGKSNINKQDDVDSDGKDDNKEKANDEDGDGDEDDDDDDDDNADNEAAEGNGKGIIGKLLGSVEAKIAKTLLKIKIYTVIFLVVFLLFLISSFESILTPDSLKAVLAFQFESFTEDAAGAWIKFTDSIEELGETISAFFTDLFGGDEDEHIDKTNAYEIQEYNYKQQYNDSLKANYTEIETALKSAYKDAKKEAKKFCKDNGYSWMKSNNSLSATNSDSWKAVYSGSNYGDLLSVANILLDEEAYESQNGYDPETFDSKRFQEFMKDENTIKHLYHINYVARVDSDEDNPDDAKYVDITIFPYDVYDLFLMGTPKVVNSDGSITDTANGPDYTNKEWSENINNADFMKERTRQIKAICNEENYELYQLDNITETNAQRASSSLLTTLADNISLDDVKGSNKKVVYEALARKGLDEVHIAAVMGNLQCENSFSTKMKGDQGSVGLCQWLGTRKTQLIAYAESKGMEVTDIKLQAEFMAVIELEAQMNDYSVIFGGKSMRGNEAFFAASDLITATDIFCTCFERCYYNSTIEGFHKKYPSSSYAFTLYHPTKQNPPPGRYYIHLDKRRACAQQFYNAITSGQYADKEE